VKAQTADVHGDKKVCMHKPQMYKETEEVYKHKRKMYNETKRCASTNCRCKRRQNVCNRKPLMYKQTVAEKHKKRRSKETDCVQTGTRTYVQAGGKREYKTKNTDLQGQQMYAETKRESKQTADYRLLNARRHFRQLHIDLQRNVWCKDA
jgi:hypothetical protein